MLHFVIELGNLKPYSFYRFSDVDLYQKIGDVFRQIWMERGLHERPGFGHPDQFLSRVTRMWVPPRQFLSMSARLGELLGNDAKSKFYASWQSILTLLHLKVYGAHRELGTGDHGFIDSNAVSDAFRNMLEAYHGLGEQGELDDLLLAEPGFENKGVTYRKLIAYALVVLIYPLAHNPHLNPTASIALADTLIFKEYSPEDFMKKFVNEMLQPVRKGEKILVSLNDIEGLLMLGLEENWSALDVQNPVDLFLLPFSHLQADLLHNIAPIRSEPYFIDRMFHILMPNKMHKTEITQRAYALPDYLQYKYYQGLSAYMFLLDYDFIRDNFPRLRELLLQKDQLGLYRRDKELLAMETSEISYFGKGDKDIIHMRMVGKASANGLESYFRLKVRSMNELLDRVPAMRSFLLDEQGYIRQGLSVTVNDEPIDSSDFERTFNPNDQVMIFDEQDFLPRQSLPKIEMNQMNQINPLTDPMKRVIDYYNDNVAAVGILTYEDYQAMNAILYLEQDAQGPSLHNKDDAKFPDQVTFEQKREKYLESQTSRDIFLVINRPESHFSGVMIQQLVEWVYSISYGYRYSDQDVYAQRDHLMAMIMVNHFLAVNGFDHFYYTVPEDIELQGLLELYRLMEHKQGAFDAREQLEKHLFVHDQAMTTEKEELPGQSFAALSKEIRQSSGYILAHHTAALTVFLIAAYRLILLYADVEDRFDFFLPHDFAKAYLDDLLSGAYGAGFSILLPVVFSLMDKIQDKNKHNYRRDDKEYYTAAVNTVAMGTILWFIFEFLSLSNPKWGWFDRYDFVAYILSAIVGFLFIRNAPFYGKEKKSDEQDGAMMTERDQASIDDVIAIVQERHRESPYPFDEKWRVFVVDDQDLMDRSPREIVFADPGSESIFMEEGLVQRLGQGDQSVEVVLKEERRHILQSRIHDLHRQSRQTTLNQIAEIDSFQWEQEWNQEDMAVDAVEKLLAIELVAKMVSFIDVFPVDDFLEEGEGDFDTITDNIVQRVFTQYMPENVELTPDAKKRIHLKLTLVAKWIEHLIRQHHEQGDVIGLEHTKFVLLSMRSLMSLIGMNESEFNAFASNVALPKEFEGMTWISDEYHTQRNLDRLFRGDDVIEFVRANYNELVAAWHDIDGAMTVERDQEMNTLVDFNDAQFFSIVREEGYYKEYTRLVIDSLRALEESIQTPEEQRASRNEELTQKYNIPSMIGNFLHRHAKNLMSSDEQGDPQYIEGEGFNYEGIRYMADGISQVNQSEKWMPYFNYRVQFDFVYEIANSGVFSIDNQIQRYLKEVNAHLINIIEGEATAQVVYDDLTRHNPLLSQDDLRVSLLLKWLGNIAEMKESPQMQLRARQFLEDFITLILERNKDILFGFADFIFEISDRQSQKKGPVKIAMMHTGAESLGYFLRARSKVMNRNDDIQDLVLTVPMMNNLKQFYDSTTPFLTDESRQFLQGYLKRVNVLNDTTQHVLFVDAGFAGSFSGRLKQVLKPLSIEHNNLLLFHVKSSLDGNEIMGLNERSGWSEENMSQRIHRLAFIMDDGFEASISSPLRFDDDGNPIDIRSTPRPWLHQLIKSSVDEMAVEVSPFDKVGLAPQSDVDIVIMDDDAMTVTTEAKAKIDDYARQIEALDKKIVERAGSPKGEHYWEWNPDVRRNIIMMALQRRYLNDETQPVHIHLLFDDRDENVIGYVVYEDDVDNDWVALHYLAVDPDFAGQGKSISMLRHVMNHALDAGYARLYGMAYNINEHALHIYRHVYPEALGDMIEYIEENPVTETYYDEYFRPTLIDRLKYLDRQLTHHFFRLLKRINLDKQVRYIFEFLGIIKKGKNIDLSSREFMYTLKVGVNDGAMMTEHDSVEVEDAAFKKLAIARFHQMKRLAERKKIGHRGLQSLLDDYEKLLYYGMSENKGRNFPLEKKKMVMKRVKFLLDQKTGLLDFLIEQGFFIVESNDADAMHSVAKWRGRQLILFRIEEERRESIEGQDVPIYFIKQIGRLHHWQRRIQRLGVGYHEYQMITINRTALAEHYSDRILAINYKRRWWRKAKEIAQSVKSYFEWGEFSLKENETKRDVIEELLLRKAFEGKSLKRGLAAAEESLLNHESDHIRVGVKTDKLKKIDQANEKGLDEVEIVALGRLSEMLSQLRAMIYSDQPWFTLWRVLSEARAFDKDAPFDLAFYNNMLLRKLSQKEQEDEILTWIADLLQKGDATEYLKTHTRAVYREVYKEYVTLLEKLSSDSSPDRLIVDFSKSIEENEQQIEEVRQALLKHGTNKDFVEIGSAVIISENAKGKQIRKRVYEYRNGIKVIEKTIEKANPFRGSGEMENIRELAAANRNSVVPLIVAGEKDVYYELDLRLFGYKSVMEQKDDWMTDTRRRTLIKAVNDGLRFDGEYWFEHGHLHGGNIVVKTDDMGDIVDVRVIDFDYLRKIRVDDNPIFAAIRDGNKSPQLGEKIPEISLDWMDLSGFDFQNAIRTLVTVYGSILYGTNFSGANFREMSNGFLHSDPRHMIFRDGELYGIEFPAGLDMEGIDIAGTWLGGLETEDSLRKVRNLHKMRNLGHIRHVEGAESMTLRELVARITNQDVEDVHFDEDGAMTADDGFGYVDLAQQADGFGGIDFNPESLNIQTTGAGAQTVRFNFTPKQIEQMRRDITGFTPVIINIQPVKNLPLLLGLDDGPSSLPGRELGLAA